MSGTVCYRLAGLLLAGLFIATCAGAWQPAELDASVPRVRLAPLFDVPIRDASICKGADGRWYLTGTYDRAGKGDFQNNDGIHLWRSTDLKEWKPVGQVWSIEKGATAPHSAWQRERRVNPDDPRGPLVRGMVSPEIHSFRDTYWITYSMNGQGTGLLKSTTGKPEGPYEDLGCITEQGTDASLFVDEDGSVYWVVGQGFAARMKPDLSGLAEACRRNGFTVVTAGKADHMACPKQIRTGHAGRPCGTASESVGEAIEDLPA